MDIMNFMQFLTSTSIEELSRYYEDAVKNIDDIELFQKWKDVIDKSIENGFKTSDNTKLAVMVYFVYKMRGGK